MTMPFSQPPIDPPDQPLECLWCDGQCTVEVYSVTDVGGKVQRIGPFSYTTVAPEIACPRCDGTGTEPPRERDDDPQIP
jgi:hypothetical protein